MQTAQEAASERQLFDAFVTGDDAAFEIIFRRYHDRLVRDAQRYVSEDAAEDLVQDVFTWLWMHRAQWRIRTTVRKYLHSAVRNRARDLIARATTERHATSAYLRAADGQYAASPEDDLLTRELASTIALGLDDCAARCRAALLLLEDHPRYSDIARELGIQPGTVHTLVARGRRQLRAYLRDQGWEEMLSVRPPLSVVTGAPTSSFDGAARPFGATRPQGCVDRNATERVADRAFDFDLDLAG